MNGVNSASLIAAFGDCSQLPSPLSVALLTFESPNNFVPC